mmetsp:Transcript_62220/g.92297  ORF Transcript_62220/g.92297 Transcript_62220/m.92297 type:complete len:396 (+) Transcript_62220:5388-6575(+)
MMASERIFHHTRVGHDIFLVDKRYTQLKLIGRGAYGSVVSAFDTVVGECVAIKKIRNLFDDEIIAKRILREIKLLRHFNSHENVVTVHDIMVFPKDTENFDDVYIVLNLMESDLDQIIRSSQPLTDQHHQYFLYQILRGLKYVHSANVIHRDLKPSNLLVNANCDLALCDFGLSRGVDGEIDDNLTEYVVTRWYRAPELLCDSTTYGKGVDVWSIGCIFAGMLCRKPLFEGESPHHQLELIVKHIGCQSPLNELGFPVHPVAIHTLEIAQETKPTGLRNLLPADINDDALDLLEKMLVVRPDDRITVEDAIAHPYLNDLHLHMTEPVCQTTFDSGIETNIEDEGNVSASKEKLQKMMAEEIMLLNLSSEDRPMVESLTMEKGKYNKCSKKRNERA